MYTAAKLGGSGQVAGMDFAQRSDG
jgi:hypothetical protein